MTIELAQIQPAGLACLDSRQPDAALFDHVCQPLVASGDEGGACSTIDEVVHTHRTEPLLFLPCHRYSLPGTSQAAAAGSTPALPASDQRV